MVDQELRASRFIGDDEEAKAILEALGRVGGGENDSRFGDRPRPPRVGPSLDKGLNGFLAYRTKAKGTCEQGQRADLTGCTPADGEPPSAREVVTRLAPVAPLARALKQDSSSPRAEKAKEQLTAFLDQGIALSVETYNNDPKAKFSNPIDYVKAKGKEFLGSPLPEGIRRGEAHGCFMNASQLVMEHDDWTYAEGFAMREGLLPVLHGWAVTADGRVVDNTWDDPEHSAYLGVVYDRAAYLKHLYKKKFYGLLGGRDKDSRQILQEGGLPMARSRGRRKKALAPLSQQTEHVKSLRIKYKGVSADRKSFGYLVKSGESYFATCERDESGRCLPSGQSGGKKPDEGKPSKVEEIQRSERKRKEPIDPEIAGTPIRPDGEDTMTQYTDEKGGWSKERIEKVHKPILAGLRKGIEKAPDGNPILYMTGGGYGSGKSTLLDKFPELVGFPGEGKAVRSDPDAMKSGIPEYQKYAGGPDPDPGAASYVHEESSDVCKTAVNGGLTDGYHVVYDTSGDTGIQKLHDKVVKMRAKGATRVEAHYAFPGSVAEAQRRADSRAKNATGLRRFVPPALLAANHAEVARCWLGTAKLKTFDKLTLWGTVGKFGDPPKLIATAVDGRIEVADRELFDEFRKIGES